VGSDVSLDLVLIDIAMPEINGVEAIHAILKQRPALPFLYMTGYVGPSKLDPSESRVVKKPFTIAELASKVEEVLFPSGDGRLSENVVPITAHKPAARTN
jgi:CheY-like chemotaxis protein